MFISYAQNFEDVILWRALKHVPDGFYIDVGAQDPVSASVSLGFYQNGWRGIHIEANADYAEKIRLARPDEEVLEVAIDRQNGEIEFFEICDTGLSTGDIAIARKHEAGGWNVIKRRIPSLTLSSVLNNYADRDIHWLKIDVEGMEEAVIEGWPPSPVRPWVVVIESTLPLSQTPNHHCWEATILSLGYKFVYFDGLNRFYVSIDHPELEEAFGPGPNIFDEFKLADTSDFFLLDVAAERAARAGAERERDERQASLRDAQRRFDIVRTGLESLLADERAGRAKLEQEYKEREEAQRTENQIKLALGQQARDVLELQLDAFKASRSWKLTAPLRDVSTAARWLLKGTKAWLTMHPDSRPRRVLRHVATISIQYVLASSRITRYGKRALPMVPARVRTKLLSMLVVTDAISTSHLSVQPMGNDELDLSARSRKVLTLLTAEQDGRSNRQ